MYDKLYFHMDGPKIVRYKFSPKFIYGGHGYEYGYVCGGQNTNIIDRFSFSFDQGNTVQVGSLSDDRNETSANNSTTHGYICGGRKLATRVRTMDRIFFPLDSGNALDFSAISTQKFATCSYNSQCFGYVCGGQTTVDVNHVERFNFALLDNEATIHSSITLARKFSASNNSSIYGYVCGGISSIEHNIIDRCNFGLDADPHIQIATLSNNQSYFGGNNSTSYGYACGGSQNNINRINFASDGGVASTTGTLENNRNYSAANNSTTHGYICGGENTNIISKFSFPLDSGVAISHSELTTTMRNQPSATDGVDGVILFAPQDTGPGPGFCDGFQYDASSNTGYYGITTVSQLISGDDLASHLLMTSGVSMNSDAGWLKFYIDGKIIFIAKKPFRHSISWNQIYNLGAVYGISGFGPYTSGTNVDQNKEITIGEYHFKIRLMTGAHINPFTRDANCTLSSGAGENSEWNRLIYRVHNIIPNCGSDGLSTTYHGGNQIGNNWASFNDSDLGLGDVNARRTWCQESYSYDISGKCRRGQGNIAGFSYTAQTSNSTFDGWRPVLELI